MVLPRRQRQANLPNNLRPQVQRLKRRAEVNRREVGPTVPCAHDAHDFQVESILEADHTEISSPFGLLLMVH